MNKMILIVLLLVALVAGGGGAYFIVKGGGAKTPPKLPAQLIELEERTINLRGDGQYLKIAVAVEAAGKGGGKEFIKEISPPLFDILIDEVGHYSKEELLKPAGKKSLKEKLHKGFTEALKEEHWEVREVLFTDFVME